MIWNTHTPKYLSLDHWRAVAALGVVVFHGFLPLRNSGLEVHPSLAWLAHASSVGWFGVHLFFVISGYCISAATQRLLMQNASAGTFLRDRLMRIYPLYWIVCLLVILKNMLAAPFNHVPIGDNLPGSALAAFANLFLLEPYLGVDPQLLLVAWSLVYEVGFYFIVAIGIFAYRLGIPGPLLLSAAAIAAVLGITIEPGGAFLALKYWPEFVFGAAAFLALLPSRRSDPIRLLAILLPLILGLIAFGAMPEGRRAWEICGAGLFAYLLIALHPWDKITFSLSPTAWLGHIGVFSYSLYLVHVPFGGAFVNFASRWIRHDSGAYWLVQIGYWTVSVSIAYVVFRLFEAPIERIRHSLRRPPLLAPTVKTHA